MKVNPIDNLKSGLGQNILSERVKRIAQNTFLQIPKNVIDISTSNYHQQEAENPYISLKICSKGNQKIPLDISFGLMIDFHCENAAVLEMMQVTTDEEENVITSLINMWLSSKIEKIEYRRGHFVSKTLYRGSHSYMHKRNLFARTTPFGVFGKKVLAKNYEPWIII